MKTLVVFYSFGGNNEKLARYFQEKIDCDVSKLETVRKRNGFSVFLDILFNRKPLLKPISFDLKDYDHVIFMAPIWTGKIAMPMKSFLISESKQIKDYSFVTFCGGGIVSQKDNVVDQLTSMVGHKPQQVLELWTKKIMDSRKNSSVAASAVKVETEDFQLFTNELNEFTAMLFAHDSMKSTSPVSTIGKPQIDLLS